MPATAAILPPGNTRDQFHHTPGGVHAERGTAGPTLTGSCRPQRRASCAGGSCKAIRAGLGTGPRSRWLAPSKGAKAAKTGQAPPTRCRYHAISSMAETDSRSTGGYEVRFQPLAKHFDYAHAAAVGRRQRWMMGTLASPTGNPRSGHPISLGLPGLPAGWFSLGESASLGPTHVVAANWLGTEVVLWRSATGQAHVMGAFCPHLGAHLGYGGEVSGEQLRCPFHGWAFDTAGRCVSVPYAAGPPSRACLQATPVHEANGLIMAWRDHRGRSPEWFVPDVAEFNDDSYLQFEPRSWEIAAPLWEIGENVVDVQHFRYLHRTEGLTDWWTKEEGPTFAFGASMGVRSPLGVASTKIETTQWGPGFAVTRYGGALEICQVTAAAPIDGSRTRIELRFAARAGIESRPRLMRHLVDRIVRQFEEDRKVWEHKAYLPLPMLAVGDGPIMRYRRWLAQFMPKAVDAPAVAG
jgi:3-ketosteroid 9alpha-monooxygenase subunit A